MLWEALFCNQDTRRIRHLVYNVLQHLVGRMPSPIGASYYHWNFAALAKGVVHYWWSAKMDEVPNLVKAPFLLVLGAWAYPPWFFQHDEHPSAKSRVPPATEASMALSPKLRLWSYVPPRRQAQTSSLGGLVLVHRRSATLFIQVSSLEYPTTIHYLDWWSRATWRLERAGTPKAAPISTSIEHVTHSLWGICAGFSLFFIGHVFCFSTSTTSIDRYLGDLILRSWFFWPVEHSAPSPKLSNKNFDHPQHWEPLIFGRETWSNGSSILDLYNPLQLCRILVIDVKGVPPPNFFLQHHGKGDFPKCLAIKEAALAFKAKHGEGINLQNRLMMALRPWMIHPPPTGNWRTR